MNQGYNLKSIGVVVCQFLESVLKNRERATLNEVHARQHDPASHTRLQADDIAPLRRGRLLAGTGGPSGESRVVLILNRLNVVILDPLNGPKSLGGGAKECISSFWTHPKDLNGLWLPVIWL
jgi:hypothetical protein